MSYWPKTAQDSPTIFFQNRYTPVPKLATDKKVILCKVYYEPLGWVKSNTKAFALCNTTASELRHAKS